MNYIPYPRIDLDTHKDLVIWRTKATKSDGDWTDLKEYLAENARIIKGKHPISKCWYSELPQGDDFARDVEHFRPKNQASPLSAKQIKEFEALAMIKYEQDEIVGSYNWLEFDYRNYRLVTAKPNRGGGKHVYFPIAKGKARLTNTQNPWSEQEYYYLLDPTNKNDTLLLMVKPNGEIAPLAPKTQLIQDDFDGLPETWQENGFNYLRAMVTIKLYRLNDAVFLAGRKEVFDKITRLTSLLELCTKTNADKRIINSTIEDIAMSIIPSAPFSLAAKSALIAYQPNNGNSEVTAIIQSILLKVETQIKELTVDWNKP
jgi:hypothetical protein